MTSPRTDTPTAAKGVLFETAFARATSPLAVVALGSGAIVVANDALAGLVGETPDALRGRRVGDLLCVAEEELAPFRNRVADAPCMLRSPAWRLRAAPDTWVETQWTLLHVDADAGQLAFVGLKDATAQRAAEEALRRSEELYRGLVEAANVGVWSVDAENRIAFANATMAELLRTTVDGVVGTGLADWLFPEDVAVAEARLEARRSGESERFETRYRRADGSPLHVLVSAIPFRRDGSVALAMVNDITELRESQAELARDAARQEIVAELGQLALSESSADAFLADALAAAAEALGTEYALVVELGPDDHALTLRAAYGARDEDVGARIPFDSQSGAAILALSPLVVEDAESDPRFTPSPLMRAFGVVSGISCPIVVADEPLGVLALNTRARRSFDERDVAFVRSVATLVGWTIRRERSQRERERAGEALRASEERFRMLAENSADVVYRIRLQPSVAYEYVSPAVTAIVGHTPDEFYADPGLVARRMHPDDRELLESSITAEGAIVVRWIREDGSVVWGERRAQVVRDERGVPVAVEGRIRDVTEQVRAEEARAALEAQLLHAQKMEAIGRLAGGVAHDFNNLLTAMIGYADILIDRGLSAEALNDVLEIRAASTRAASLTGQLLTFGRRQVLELEHLDVSEVAAELEQMLRRLIGEHIELHARLAPDLPPVLADRGSITQVLMNLVVNARDAMSGGGELRIETSEVELDEGYASMHVGAEPGRYVLLEVSDTGSGMDEETRARIFEPFFTTKEVGSGTGLGLSTVYGIVRQSGGVVFVYSEPGLGTTFKVYLPAAARCARPDEAPPAPAAVSTCNGETVLLVEDEEIVRALVAETLKRAGYRVVAAANGEEALATFEREHVDVVITDVVMPHVGGPELVERLRRIRPDVRVLFTSGYADEIVGDRTRLGSSAFLQKPFSGEALRVKLRELGEAAA